MTDIPPIAPFPGPNEDRSGAPPQGDRHFRVNFVLILISCVALVSVGLGLHFLHGWQITKQKEVRRKRAEALIADDKPKKALRLLRGLVAVEPDNVETRARYVEILEESAESPADWSAVLLSYEELLARDPERTADRRHYVELALQAGRQSHARSHIEVLLAETPEDGEASFWMGLCQESEREYAEAAESYAAAIRYGFNEVQVTYRLASILHSQLDQPSEADVVIAAMRAQHGDSTDALMIASQFHAESGNMDRATGLIRLAKKQAPDNHFAVMGWAQLLIRDPATSGAQFSAIQSALEELIANNVTDDDNQLGAICLMMARCHLRLGNQAAAIEEFRNALEWIPNGVEPRISLIDTLIDTRSIADAKREISELDKSVHASVRHYMVGRLALVEDDYQSAIAELEEAYELAEDDRTRIRSLAAQSLASAYRAIGRPQEEIRAFQRALDDDPSDVFARRGLAAALGEQGRVEDALATLAPVADAGILRARLQFLLASRQSPSDEEWKSMQDSLENAEPAGAGSEVVTELAIAVAIRRLSRAKDRDGWTELRSAHPGNARIRRAEIVWVRENEGSDAALALLKQAESELGNSLEMQFAWIDHWSEQSGEDATLSLAQKLDEKAESEDDRFAILALLVAVFQQRGESSHALRAAEEMCSLRPHWVPSHFLRFRLALAGKQTKVSDDALQQLRDLESEEGSHFRLATSMLKISEGETGPSQRRTVQRILEYRPDWPIALAVLAELDTANGDPAAALQNYRRAIELGLRSPEVLTRTAELIRSQGTHSALSGFVDELEDDVGNETFAVLQRHAITHALHGRDPKKAHKHALQAIEADPNNAANHLALGQVQLALRQGREAEDSFRKAVDVDPTNPLAWITLLRYVQERKTPKPSDEEVQQLAAKAIAALGDDHLGAAYCHELVGQLQEAQPRFLQAYEAGRDDPMVARHLIAFLVRTKQTAEGIRRLKQLVASDIPLAHTLWARRQLAVVVARTSYSQFRTAIDLLDKNLEEAPTSLVDLRTKALILISRPERAHRHDAVALFEKLHSANALNGDDRVLFAQLLDTLGMASEAEFHWAALRTMPDIKSEVHAAYVRRQLGMEKTKDARAALTQLQRAIGRTPLVVGLEANILAAEGKHASAVRTMTDHVTKSDSGSKSSRQMFSSRNLQRLSGVVPEDQRKRYLDAAESVVRDLVASDKANTEYTVLLAEVLARQGKELDAIEVLDKAATADISPTFTQTGINILQRIHSPLPQRKIVEEWVKRSMKQRPNSPETLAFAVQWGNLLILANRTTEAETTLRRVVNAAPNNIMALNNLAWVLTHEVGNHDEALKMVEKAIDTAGPLWQLLDTRACIWLNQGRVNEAVLGFTEALEVSDSSYARMHLAIALLERKEQAAAAIHFRKATQAGLDVRDLGTVDQDYYKRLDKLGD